MPNYQRHPERGIVYLENIGPYQFKPYAFTIASRNQWTVLDTGDLHKDGRLDVIIGAMNLGNLAKGQRRFTGQPSDSGQDAILLFENRMRVRSHGGKR
jgi:hypothetical protein